MTFTPYRRKQIAELRPYVPEENMTGISISMSDSMVGSPKPGDMIARNPKNYDDQWLVAKRYFEDNFEPAEAAPLLEEAHPLGCMCDPCTCAGCGNPKHAGKCKPFKPAKG